MILLFILIFQSTNTIAWSLETPTTFVISNEAPGYLIDNLIKQGYGDSCLYAVTKHLQPLSGGAIPQWFMDSLAACPSGSDIFTAELSNFAGLNNPVGINTDGTLIITAIYGRDYYKKEGYGTYSDTQQGVCHELFTYATSPQYYIEAGQIEVNYGGGIVTNTLYYQAFAIAWELSSTFVLSNEEGGLIDDLIARGYGNSNLYQTLVTLAPSSNGVISEAFLEILARCPAGSQIFTQKLNNYAQLNGAVCINTNGTVFTTTGIKGRDYYGDTGYSTYPTATEARESFTYANNFNYYIDAVNGGTTYKVFAIAWGPSIPLCFAKYA